MLDGFSPDKLLKRKLVRLGFQAKELAIGSCTMRYLEKTQPGRPTVVLLHGISAAAVHYERVLPRIYLSGYNVIAPDLPGHGFSTEHCDELTADRVFECFVHFLDTVAPPKFHLVGNSLGGALSLRYALHHSERLLSVTALSPAGGFETEEDWESFKEGLQLNNRAAVKGFLNRIYAKPPWYLPLVYGFAMKAMNRKGVQDLIATTTINAFAEAKRLKEISVPLLFIWGKGERLFPTKNLEWFRRNLPAHAIIEEPEGVGHCPQLESSKWLVHRLERFFSQGH